MGNGGGALQNSQMLCEEETVPRLSTRESTGDKWKKALGDTAVCWEVLAPERLHYVIDCFQERSNEFAKLRDGK